MATSVWTISPVAGLTPVSRPANSRASPSSSTCTPTSAPSPDTSARPSSRLNQNRPPNSASRGSAQIAASSSSTHGRTSARPPARPDIGEATMLRTRSCVGDGNSPAPAMASATASTSAIPRNCTLPRAVSSSVPEPNSVEAAASVDNWAGVIAPPGSRTRASAPSAARCTCRAPGQASASGVRGMIHDTTSYGTLSHCSSVTSVMRGRRSPEPQGSPQPSLMLRQGPTPTARQPRFIHSCSVLSSRSASCTAGGGDGLPQITKFRTGENDTSTEPIRALSHVTC